MSDVSEQERDKFAMFGLPSDEFIILPHDYLARIYNRAELMAEEGDGCTWHEELSLLTMLLFLLEPSAGHEYDADEYKLFDEIAVAELERLLQFKEGQLMLGVENLCHRGLLIKCSTYDTVREDYGEDLLAESDGTIYGYRLNYVIDPDIVKDYAESVRSPLPIERIADNRYTVVEKDFIRKIYDRGYFSRDEENVLLVLFYLLTEIGTGEENKANIPYKDIEDSCHISIEEVQKAIKFMTRNDGKEKPALLKNKMYNLYFQGPYREYAHMPSWLHVNPFIVGPCLRRNTIPDYCQDHYLIERELLEVVLKTNREGATPLTNLQLFIMLYITQTSQYKNTC